MMQKASLFIVGALLLAIRAPAADVLLTHVLIYDGTGSAGYAADVRIHGDRIAAVAHHLKPRLGETTLNARGLALAPGFIDMHSHGSRGLFEDLDAATISRQGITTIFVGQDGESDFPLADFFAHFAATPAATTLPAWSVMLLYANRSWATTCTDPRRRQNSRK